MTSTVSHLLKQRLLLIHSRKISPGSFQRIPTELVTEIISDVLADGMTMRSIASVCKSFRAVILGTPKFWRRIIINQWSADFKPLKCLKRALQLSGSATLDVVFSFSQIIELDWCQLLEYFKALADAGVHRWRSLTLMGPPIPKDRQSPFLGVFSGKMTSLRSLTISNDRPSPDEQDMFDPIYSLIAESKPCLHEFDCSMGEVPEVLANPPLYHNLRSISASFTTIAKLRPKFDLPNLRISNMPDTETFKPFDLPHTTTFSMIRFTNFCKCGFGNVEELIIALFHDRGDNSDDGNEDPKPETLKFPTLRSLEVFPNSRDGTGWFLYIEAPRLSSLTISDIYDMGSGATNTAIHHFETEGHRIKIAPTHLVLGFDLNLISTLCVLQQWPQLQDLTLHWDKKFEWGGTLLKGLCCRNDISKALCPNLQVLRIVMEPIWPQEAVDKWLQAGRQILRFRKGVLPLWKITVAAEGWMVPKASYTVTIFDIE